MFRNKVKRCDLWYNLHCGGLNIYLATANLNHWNNVIMSAFIHLYSVSLLKYF